MGNFCRSGSVDGSTHHPSVGLGFKIHYISYELNFSYMAIVLLMSIGIILQIVQICVYNSFNV